nr:isoaspartyl peptidase/L-asparaginase [Bartonella apihabitans]
MSSPVKPVIAIHGGAGTMRSKDMTEEKERAYRHGLTLALEAGRAVLKANGSAVDAVTASVMALEDDPLFNAGRGAVYTTNRTQEMDAAIMDGRDRNAGAVAGILGCVIRFLLPALLWKKPNMFFLPVTEPMNFAARSGSRSNRPNGFTPNGA